MGSLYHMKRTLREFLDDVEKLKGPEFKFSFAGFRLTKTMLYQIDFGIQEDECVYDEYVYLKNYKLFEPDATLGFIHTVDYNRLMSNVTGELPSCFFKKFPCIQQVRVEDAVQDANHFLHLLKSLSFLRRLTIHNSRLGQEFYDQLPASAHLLTTLRLYEYIQKQLYFGFIAQFSQLSSLSIGNERLNFESLASLVSCLVNLKEGHFDFKRSSCLIRKKDVSKVYEVFKNYQSVLKTEHRDSQLFSNTF